MKIIISPAKQMENDDNFSYKQLPQLLDKTKQIYAKLNSMTYEEQKALWGCNEALAEEAHHRLERSLEDRPVQALSAYKGLQYIHMGSKLFTRDEWHYLCDSLRILSGLYGILRPDDGIVPYRLEMQAKLDVDGTKNLYRFWNSAIAEALFAEEACVLNLASKEYSKAVEPYLKNYPKVKFVTCEFACGTEAKHKVKATEAKMARGSMVRWCAENKAQKPEDVKAFNVYGYVFCESQSDETHYLFLKK